MPWWIMDQTFHQSPQEQRNKVLCQAAAFVAGAKIFLPPLVEEEWRSHMNLFADDCFLVVKHKEDSKLSLARNSCSQNFHLGWLHKGLA